MTAGLVQMHDAEAVRSRRGTGRASADALTECLRDAARGPGKELLLRFETTNQRPREEQAVVRERPVIENQSRSWGVSRAGARAAVPAKKAPADKRAADTAR